MVKVYLLDKGSSSLKSYISVGGDLNEFSRYQTIFIAYVSKSSHPPCCNCPGLQLNTGFPPDGSTFVWRWKTIKDLITNIVNKYLIKSKWYPIWFYFFPKYFYVQLWNPWGPCIDSRNIVRTIQILRFIKMLAIVVTQILYKKI